MKRRFLLFVVSVFCCLLFPVAAQERQYTVTETELTQLESISQSLQKAESKAKNLNSQLQAERDALKNLRASYSAYEKEAARQIAEMQTLIDKQKDKIHRLSLTAITLLTALSMAIVFIVIKLKRFFPFLL